MAFWLVCWQLAAWAVGRPLLLVGPVETVAALASLAATPGFWVSVGVSCAHVALGFVTATASGCALAFVASARPVVARLVEPAMLALKSVPVACVVVILLLWVGSGGVGVACVAVVVLPVYYFSCLEGLSASDHARARVLGVLGVPGPVRALALVWPGLVPHVLGSTKVAVGMAWKAGVAAELIALSGLTLGERVYQAKLLLDTPALMAWTVTVVACAALCERAVVALVARSGPACARWAVARARAAAPAEPGAVSCEGLSVSFGGPPVVRGVTLDCGPGERVCLVGASGAGKSSVVGALVGLVPAGSGTVSHPDPVGLAPQAPSLVEWLSAADNVALVTGDAPRARAALARLVPDADPDRPVEALSGGQRRRVEVARAVLCPGGAVILDEPFAGLDAESRAATARFVLDGLGGRPLVAAVHGDDEAALLGARAIYVGRPPSGSSSTGAWGGPATAV